MARFRFDLEYEGTRYSGWQVQRNARTVQGDLMEALIDALGTDDFEFAGSGRTDAGVHALRQVAHLDAHTGLAPHVLRMRVNDLLPPDINVVDVRQAHPKFHARHSALSRSYVYQIAQRRTAFGKKYVWWVKDRLNTDNMRAACKVFEGFHDFRSFTADDPDEKSTKVELQECSLHQLESMLIIRIRGSHFLWKMVRQMVGIIVESGRPGNNADGVGELLHRASTLPATKTAPPSGLFLEHVQYDPEERPPEIRPFPWID